MNGWGDTFRKWLSGRVLIKDRMILPVWQAQLNANDAISLVNENRINLNQELDLTTISSTGLGWADLSIASAEDALIATK